LPDADKTMRTKLNVEIVTHDGVAYQGEVDGLVAPGTDGYFGLLPRHAPMIAELGVGGLRLRRGNQWEHFALAGGILHVRDGAVVIMADSIEKAEQIDVERARAAVERARQRLGSRPPGIDLHRAELAMMRAMNRLQVADRT
jgi:F-type H+-transporting ATPase subunit epsilon